MKTLKEMLRDKRLNTSQFGTLAFPKNKRATAARALDKVLKSEATLPEGCRSHVRQLIFDIRAAVAATSPSKVLALTADSRLIKAPLAVSIWPGTSPDAARLTLRNRQHNNAIVGAERARLHNYLLALAGELHDALKNKEA